MERTRQIKKPDLILTSDWHLREDTPVCWTGDFQEEQWVSVAFIAALQKRYDCPVVHAGDLFHHWKPSPWLLSKAIIFLPEKFYTIYGQHDLPQHNWELLEKSGIHTLDLAGRITVCFGTHWGHEVATHCHSELPLNMMAWHHMTYILPPFPGATGGQAEGILRKYKQFDLIVTGDNHQSFSTSYQGRLLVNPGSLTRQTADQADFQPRVALWYADTNTIDWVNIPIQDNVITREHIEKVEERDARIDAFISKLDTDFKAELSFEDNLEVFFQQNNIRDSVKEIIYRSLE
jgi:DNA repair exonuclease SbcCD nuclease subunit